MSMPPDDTAADPVDRQPPVTSAEDVTSRLAIDLFALKSLQFDLHLDEPAPTDQARPPVRRWRHVWSDCHAHLQEFVVSSVEFLAAVPRNSVRLLDGIGTGSLNFAEMLRRIARGRAKGDHHEDEKIARAEEQGPPSEPAESQAMRESAVLRFADLKERLAAKGTQLCPVVTDDGKIVFMAVAEEAQRAVLEATQAKLLQHDRNATSDDGVPATISLVAGPVEEQGIDALLRRDPNKSSETKRLVTVLQKAGIKTLRELTMMTVEEALAIPGIGNKSLQVLRKYLKDGERVS